MDGLSRATRASSLTQSSDVGLPSSVKDSGREPFDGLNRVHTVGSCWGLEPVLTHASTIDVWPSADRNSARRNSQCSAGALPVATAFEQRCAKTFPRVQETGLGNAFGGPQWDREESRRGFGGPLGSSRLAKMSMEIRASP